MSAAEDPAGGEGVADTPDGEGEAAERRPDVEKPVVVGNYDLGRVSAHRLRGMSVVGGCRESLAGDLGCEFDVQGLKGCVLTWMRLVGGWEMEGVCVTRKSARGGKLSQSGTSPGTARPAPLVAQPSGIAMMSPGCASKRWVADDQHLTTTSTPHPSSLGASAPAQISSKPHRLDRCAYGRRNGPNPAPCGLAR